MALSAAEHSTADLPSAKTRSGERSPQKLPAPWKHRINDAYRKFRFRISANNNPFFILCYKWFYHPKKGTLSYFLDRYSRSKKGDFTVIQIGANDGINNDPIYI